jgi:FMN reductase
LPDHVNIVAPEKSPSYLIISCSLNPQSRSRILARRAHDHLKETRREVAFVDLADHPLPLCDGDRCYDHPEAQGLGRSIQAARGVLLATPIYNFGASASAKNLVELTGEAWNEKVIGFLCAAGGKGSYMSVLGLANSLMLDFRCLILPRFVYAVKSAFEGERLTDPEIDRRLRELVETLARVSEALRP